LKIFGVVVAILPLFILACWLVAEAASLLEVGSLFSMLLGTGLGPTPCVEVFKQSRIVGTSFTCFMQTSFCCLHGKLYPSICFSISWTDGVTFKESSFPVSPKNIFFRYAENMVAVKASPFLFFGERGVNRAVSP